MSEAHPLIANRYQLVALIGQGGMGDVYRGIDQHTGETVAIKALKPELTLQSPDVLERFRREAEALRKLNHPNIVKMLDTVEEEGQHYLVMEYVGGGSLRDLLDRQPRLPIRRVLEIALDLADALTRVHRLKITHRDIKPANILLAEDGTPRLTDFGMARLGDHARVTATGALVGTYGYLSPEACLGERLDARTDIWSFGVVLYEMLAGRRPFESDTGASVLVAILQKPVPNLLELRPETPPALADLIERMLEKDREKRIRSVRRVGAALEAILNELDGEGVARLSSRFATPTNELTPSELKPPTELPYADAQSPESLVVIAPPQPAARRSALWVLVGVAVVVAALLGGAFFALSRRSEPATPPKPPPWAAAPLVEPVDEGEYMVLVAQFLPIGETPPRNVSQFIVEDLTQRVEDGIPFSFLRVRSYPRPIASAEEARKVAEANGASVVVWGNYSQDMVDAFVQIGSTRAQPYLDPERSIPRDVLERSANLRVQMQDEHRASLAVPVLHVMNVLFTADGDGYAVTHVLAIIDEMHADAPPSGGSSTAIHLYQGALPYFQDTQQALEEYSAALELDPGNPIPYTFRAMAYMRQGELEKSALDANTAQRLGPEGWTTPIYLQAIIALTENDLESAQRAFDRLVELRPDDWAPITFRAMLEYLRGDWEAAQADSLRAIALQPNVNFPYFIASIFALHEGRMVDMQRYSQIALERYPDPYVLERRLRTIYDEQSKNAVYLVSEFVAAAGNLLLGQYEATVENVDNAFSVDDQLPDLYLLQGLAYCALGQYAQSEAVSTRGIEIAPDFMLLYLMRAQARLQLGKYAESLQDLAIVQASPQSALFAPMLEASPPWRCEDFLTYDYGGQNATEASTPTHE